MSVGFRWKSKELEKRFLINWDSGKVQLVLLTMEG